MDIEPTPGEGGAAAPVAEAADERSQAWAEFDAVETAAPLVDKVDPAPEDKTEPDPQPDPGAGDAGVAGDKTKTDAPPNADAASQDAAINEIWTNATPKERAALAAASKSVGGLERMIHEFNSNRGRIAALQRQVEKLEKAPKSQDAAAAQAGTDAASSGADVFSTDKWKTFAEDYPDLADIFKGAFDSQAKVIAKLESDVKPIAQARTDQNLDTQYQIVLTDHPDYEQIKGSSAFRDWYDKAPAFVKAGIERNADMAVDGPEVSTIVKLFKTETGWTAPKDPKNPPADAAPAAGQPSATAAPASRRQHQLDAASAPRSRATGPVVTGIPDDREGAWDAFERMGL